MNNTIKWGILGSASIARDNVIPAIHKSSNGTAYAIASRDITKSKAAAREFGIPKAYGSYEQLLADPEVDAVYIPLPNHLHAHWTIAAAKAGKHILCEKPGAINQAEAALMVEAVRKAGVHFAEALMYRHHPLLHELKMRVRDGLIGELRLIRASFTCSSKLDQKNIRFRKSYGGGALYDLGDYPLSAARFLTGAEPEAVTVHAGFSEQHEDVDMMASGLAEFANGVALLFDCGLWAEERRSMELVGSEGRVVIPVAFSGQKQSGYTVYRSGEAAETREQPMNSYVLEIEHFGSVVQNGEDPLFQPEDMVQNLRLLDACQTSAREKRRIVLA